VSETTNASTDPMADLMKFGYTSDNSVAGIGRVVRAKNVTRRVRRVTIASDELAKLPADLGWNRPFRAYVPQPGYYDQPFCPPLGEDGQFGDLFAMQQEHTVVRAYTLRRFDPKALEIDVDFVLHDNAGVASTWAETAKEGDGFGFLISTMEMMSMPLADVDWLLLFGDDTAIPHIANTLGALPGGRRAIAILEVDDEPDEQALDSAGDVSVQWVHRKGAPAGLSGKLEEAVRALPWPEGTIAAYVATEAKATRRLRDFLRDERGLERRNILKPGDGINTYDVAPYWRLVELDDEAIAERMARASKRAADGEDAMEAWVDEMMS
jgi:NADPH-dependent ferric siderophore reductase